MAIIGTIRKHSALAVILVGVAIGAFILSDLLTGRGGRGGLLSRGRGAPPIGMVAGEEISYNDYSKRVDDNIEIQKANNQTENISQDEAFNIRTSTWNQYLNEIIMGKEYKKLDLTVTTDELFDLVQGQHPHQLILQYFKDPNTNQYNPQMVLNFLQNLDNMKPEVKKQWLNLEKYIKEDRLNQKYQGIVAGGYYVPTAFAKEDYFAKQRKAEVRYVAISYASVPDADVTLTDADFEKYYEENKYQYEQDPSRDIDYVIFEVAPSADDRAKAREDVFQIYNEFQNTPDVAAFVNGTSDNRYDSTWFKKDQLPVTLDSLLFDSPVGTFVPPYEESNAWHMAKLLDVASRPDSMKAEHILIAYKGAYRAGENVTRTKEQAEATADSLLDVVKKENFKMQALAMQYSDDGSVQTNSGDLGWFADGSMVGPFNQAVVNGKVGDIVKVETMFGFHVVKITGIQDPVKKVRVAVIDRAIEPSTKTFQDIYTQASSFAGENNSLEKFNKAVEEKGLNKRQATYLRDMTNSIPGIEMPREIVRWTYYDGIKFGEVSPVFDVGGAYVVACLTSMREKGTIPLSQIKENLRSFVLNDKKAEYIQNKIGNSSGDLFQIARDFNAKVDTNLNLTFASRNIPGFGSEYQVIGQIFSMKSGEPSNPIKGNGAVFVVVVDRIIEPAENMSFDAYKAQLMSGFKSRVSSNTVFTALQDKTKIEDNRRLYF